MPCALADVVFGVPKVQSRQQASKRACPEKVGIEPYLELSLIHIWAYQPFLWENVKFDKDDLDKGIGYVCRECGLSLIHILTEPMEVLAASRIWIALSFP